MIGAHHVPKPWFIVALRWAAAIGVLAVLFHFLPLQPLRTGLARVPVTRFVIVLLLYLTAHCVGIAKWRMMVNAAGGELTYATSAQCYTGGLFGSLFLPSIIGGDVVRLAVGLRRSPQPAAVLAGNVADRSIDFAAQAMLVLIGVALLPGSLPSPLEIPARHVILLTAAAALLLVLLAWFFYKPVMGGRSFHFRRKLARLRHALRRVSRRPHVLLSGLLLGLLIQMTFLILTALLAISCGLFLPLRVWLFAWPLAKLAAVLPLTQGGIGVREAAMVVLLAPFGAAAPLVLAAGLVWEGIVIVGGLISGATSFVLRRVETQPAAN